jgi:hypothetical protein
MNKKSSELLELLGIDTSNLKWIENFWKLTFKL